MATPAQAASAFLGLDQDSQKRVLGQMSPEAQSDLRDALKLRSGAGLPGIAPPPGVKPETMTTPSTLWDTTKAVAAVAPHVLSAAVVPPAMNEAGEKLTDVGKGIAHQAAAVGTSGSIGGMPSLASGEELPNPANAVTVPLNELTKDKSALPDASPSILERGAYATSAAFGGDPESARQHFTQHDYQRGLADLLTVPLTTYGLGKLATSAKIPAETTRREAEALGSVIAPGVKNAETQTVAQTVQPLFKQYFAEQGLKDADLDKMFPTREHAPQSDVVGNVRRGAQASIKAADGVVDIADRPLQKLVTTFGEQPAAPVKASILNSLDQEIAGQIDDQIKAGLQKLRTKVADAETLSDLNDLKVHSNKEIQNLFTGAPGKDIAASAQAAYAWRILGDAVRDGLYPELQRLSGTDIRPFTLRERAAIQARDGIYGKYFNEVAPQQASFAAKTYLERLFQGSLYEKQFLARGLNLKPMPAGEFNTMFRRGVGTIGEGFEPETVSATGRAQKLLPPPPGGGQPFMFTIQTGLPEEVVSPGSISTGKRFAGTETVPNSSHTPLEGPSHFAQRQQLGTTAETIPESVRGKRSAAQVRADETGAAQAATPARSFTGPESTTKTKWQLVQEGEGPTVSTQGGGMLQTPNPAVARDTLNNLIEYRQRIAKVAAPPHLARLDAQIQSLQQQLDHFHAYDKAIPPTNVTVNPAKLGVRPKYGKFKQNAAAPIAGGAAANILAPPPSE